MDQKSVIQTNQFSTTLFSLMVMDPSKIIRFVKIFPMLNYAQVRIYQTLAFYAIMQYLIGHPRWPRDGRNDDPIAFCICRYIDLFTTFYLFSLGSGFNVKNRWPPEIRVWGILTHSEMANFRYVTRGPNLAPVFHRDTASPKIDSH